MTAATVLRNPRHALRRVADGRVGGRPRRSMNQLADAIEHTRRVVRQTISRIENGGDCKINWNVCDGSACSLSLRRVGSLIWRTSGARRFLAERATVGPGLATWQRPLVDWERQGRGQIHRHGIEETIEALWVNAAGDHGMHHGCHHGSVVPPAAKLVRHSSAKASS